MGQLNGIHDVGDHVLPVFFRYLFQLSCQSQVLDDCHIHVKRRLLRQITDVFLCLLRLLQNVMAVDHYRSFCGCNVAGDHIHGCRFSCSVGAQETIDLTFFRLKAQMVYRCMISIPFRQILNFYHGSSSFFCLSSARAPDSSTNIF